MATKQLSEMAQEGVGAVVGRWGFRVCLGQMPGGQPGATPVECLNQRSWRRGGLCAATGGREVGSQSLAKGVSGRCAAVFLAVKQQCP